MTRHLAIVSTAFTWGGVLLGLPSLAASLYLAWALIGVRLPPAGESGKPDYNSLVGLLVAGAQSAGKALRWFVSGAQMALVVLSIVCAILFVSAMLLWAIGRGLHAHQTWARVLGMLVACGLLLASTSCALLFRQSFAIAASSVAAVICMYTLWVLWRQFA